MNEILNHLLQSTVFAATVAVVSTTLRRNSPRLRYWLWLAASAKFLVPFSLLVSTGARIQLPPDSPSLHAVTVQQISTYFAPISEFPAPTPAHQSFQWPLALAVIWIAGAVFLLIRWFLRWRAIHAAARRATQLPIALPIQAFSSPTTMEPGIFGILHQVVLLPEGIDNSLTPEQFDAVLAHELRHARCRDNLTAALHMIAETIFWFYPLVWWIGARLMDERERDCDEAVLMQGSQPGVYARSIVQVCQAYIESPLACASGISGSDLKKRIREIMTWRGSLPVTRTGKAMLAVTAAAAASLPFALGILRAQTLPAAPTLTYDVVSIHKSDPSAAGGGFGPGPGGGLRIVNMFAADLIAFAYHVQTYQIIDAPGWAAKQGYDVTFTPDKTDTPPPPSSSPATIRAFMDRNAIRLQSVLRDRFGLVLRSETRNLPIFNLVQAKGGHKLLPHDPSKGDPSMRRSGNGPDQDMKLEGVGTTLSVLAQSLAGYLHRPVVDATRLDGQFDFTVSFRPDTDPSQADVPSTASLFTALTDQLGLKLESAKGPVQVYAVEKIEPPGEN